MNLYLYSALDDGNSMFPAIWLYKGVQITYTRYVFLLASVN